MTDAEILKALECCKGNNDTDDCEDCPLLHKECFSENNLEQLAIDLIKRLQANNKELDEKLVIYMGTIDWQAKEINRQKAEIERLKPYSDYKVWTVREKTLTVTETLEDYEAFKRGIESEARKEFADRLKCRASILCDKVTGLPISYTISSYNFDNLLKEMDGA